MWLLIVLAPVPLVAAAYATVGRRREPPLVGVPRAVALILTSVYLACNLTFAGDFYAMLCDPAWRSPGVGLLGMAATALGAGMAVYLVMTRRRLAIGWSLGAVIAMVPAFLWAVHQLANPLGMVWEDTIRRWFQAAFGLFMYGPLLGLPMAERWYRQAFDPADRAPGGTGRLPAREDVNQATLALLPSKGDTGWPASSSRGTAAAVRPPRWLRSSPTPRAAWRERRSS